MLDLDQPMGGFHALFPCKSKLYSFLSSSFLKHPLKYNSIVQFTLVSLQPISIEFQYNSYFNSIKQAQFSLRTTRLIDCEVRIGLKASYPRGSFQQHKLQPKTKPCLFLSYPPYSKGYLYLDQSTNRLYTSKHVLFNETEFPALHSSNPMHTDQ